MEEFRQTDVNHLHSQVIGQWPWAASNKTSLYWQFRVLKVRRAIPTTIRKISNHIFRDKTRDCTQALSAGLESGSQT